VDIPEEGFKHTREKSSYSMMQEIPAYFTASSKLKQTLTIQIKTTNLQRLDLSHILILKTMYK